MTDDTDVAAPLHPPRKDGLAPADLVDLVVFDADDTLWKSEDYFGEAAARFARVVTPYAVDDVDVAAVLHRIEVGNVDLTGYGVMAYTLSMVEAAIAVTNGAIPAAMLAELIDEGYRILAHPVEVLEGVVETLDRIGATHPLAVITKGDLLHQRRKLEASGLAERFCCSRVVREKNAETYRWVFDEWGVDPSRVLMVGNSMRSDVIPILELGGYAVYVPYHVTWAHEEIDDAEGHHGELESIWELDDWFRTPLGHYGAPSDDTTGSAT